jgi:tRNA pseudouridine synthase 10
MANQEFFQEGDCHICKGKMPDLVRMSDDAAKLLHGTGAKTFSLSTAIPKDWLINEEDVWDIAVSQSIKNYLNSYLSSFLEKTTGMNYVPDGQARVVFDMRSGKVELKMNDLFVFGRYLKHSPGISQSRWSCRSCNGKGCSRCGGKGRHYDSIEEIIGRVMKEHFDAGDFSMHASGREDVDATNTAGRPFVMRIRNPKKLDPNLEKISKDIGDSGLVSVIDLSYSKRADVEIVTESHFDKAYIAGIEAGRELADDAKKIRLLQGSMLSQRTPTRVAHRRSDLVRNRRVIEIEVLEIKDNTAKISIKAEAGTYIKEFISSDDGRTKPSIAGTLGTDAWCTGLTVSEIDDSYLKMLGF